MTASLAELIRLKSRTTIGLMSGTSADGVDIACCEVNLDRQTLANLGSGTVRYPPALRKRVFAIAEAGAAPLHEVAALSRYLGDFYSEAVLQFLERQRLTPDDIDLIGSHGQTVAHSAGPATPNQGSGCGTLQLGDGDLIAKKLGVVVVSDFRWADIAAGGRGAPLSPIYHQYRFVANDRKRLIINIGGIANITLLTDTEVGAATDTGPGNCISDHLMKQLYNRDYDDGGQIALSGTVNQSLLDRLKTDEIFQRSLPMALDRQEVVNILRRQGVAIPASEPERRDLIAGVAELSVWAIARAAESIAPDTIPDEVIVCGGGVHNRYFLNGLRAVFSASVLDSAAAFGSDPDFVEAECFAYLANLTISGRSVSLARVTGAGRNVILGKISQP